MVTAPGRARRRHRWANTPTTRLPVQVFFRGGDGGSVLETLRLEAAYCVAYHEQFVGGDAAGGAYQCQLTLSDPDGWTLAAGGPASALVAPAARAHGLPGAVVAGALRPVAAEVLEAGMTEALSRGAANWSAFHPFDPLPLMTPNHVYGQSTGFTCVASCLRMVLADKGLSYGENALAEALGTSSFGASRANSRLV